MILPVRQIHLPLIDTLKGTREGVFFVDPLDKINAASESKDDESVLSWYIRLAKLRSEHPELIEGNYKELSADDEQIFAFVRESATGNAAGKNAAGNALGNDQCKIAAKCTILINMSTKDAEYDASCVKNAQQIAGTTCKATKGRLRPLEAVIYSE